ncbi:MAG: glycosyltransferase [Bacteroidetes bacterium]|nr:glycosyltransferase [Bacteroidota bacterium]
MKILQVNASYKPAYVYGGPTMSVSKLSEELVKAGCEIEVFTTMANGPDELPVTPGEPTYVDGVKVIYFKRLTKDHTHYAPDLLMAMRQHVKHFDAVHIHAWWNLVSVLACRIAVKQGLPVVVSPRGTLSDYSFSNKNSLPKKLLHRFLGKGLLKRSYIHVTSDREEKAMTSLIEPRKIFNIPNFIALPDKGFNTASETKNSHLKLIFFSRIDPKKGLELLFEALKNIGIAYKLTIAGDGDETYIAGLKVIAEKNGIAGNIDWIGFRTDDKFTILQQHDLFVLPSYDENFGNSVIESLSTGTAVLISKNVGLSDYVQQNELGWVCDQEVASVREYIIMISKSRNELLRIRKKAPATIRRDFNEEALTKKYLGMYKEIIANG